MKRISTAFLLVIAAGVFGTGCNSVGSAANYESARAQNVDLHKELDRARAAADVLQTNAAELSEQNKRLQAENADLQAQLAGAQKPVAGKQSGFEGVSGVESENDGRRVTVRIAGDLLFASGKVELKGSSQKTLDDVAKVLTEKYAGHTVRVAGFTDADPIARSGWKDNLQLSCERACAVVRQLRKDGVPFATLYAAGFGENQLRETKAKSRRVEIVVELY